MITKLELLKAVCKNAGVVRRKRNCTYLTKEELMKINTYLSMHTTRD